MLLVAGAGSIGRVGDAQSRPEGPTVFYHNVLSLFVNRFFAWFLKCAPVVCSMCQFFDREVSPRIGRRAANQRVWCVRFLARSRPHAPVVHSAGDGEFVQVGFLASELGPFVAGVQESDQ